MIIVIVHHWCEPGLEPAARRRIDENGDSMARIPGFMFRYRMGTQKDAGQISTVTGWQTEVDYLRWVEEKRARTNQPPNPYARVENQVFEVAAAHDAYGATHRLLATAGGARV